MDDPIVDTQIHSQELCELIWNRPGFDLSNPDCVVAFAEYANASAKIVTPEGSQFWYGIKDELLQLIFDIFPEIIIGVDYDWGMPCIHVDAPEYGVTCFHTYMDVSDILDSYPEVEWNGLRRQFAALVWEKLDLDQRVIFADLSRDPTYSEWVTLIQKAPCLEGLVELVI